MKGYGITGMREHLYVRLKSLLEQSDFQNHPQPLGRSPCRGRIFIQRRHCRRRSQDDEQPQNKTTLA